MMIRVKCTLQTTPMIRKNPMDKGPIAEWIAGPLVPGPEVITGANSCKAGYRCCRCGSTVAHVRV